MKTIISSILSSCFEYHSDSDRRITISQYVVVVNKEGATLRECMYTGYSNQSCSFHTREEAPMAVVHRT